MYLSALNLRNASVRLRLRLSPSLRARCGGGQQSVVCVDALSRRAPDTRAGELTRLALGGSARVVLERTGTILWRCGPAPGGEGGRVSPGQPERSQHAEARRHGEGLVPRLVGMLTAVIVLLLAMLGLRCCWACRHRLPEGSMQGERKRRGRTRAVSGRLGGRFVSLAVAPTDQGEQMCVDEG